MTAMDVDAGVAVVNHIFESLRVEDSWSVRRARGFRWLAWRLCQVVRASPPFEDAGHTLSRVQATTTVLRNTVAPVPSVGKALLMLNREALGSAWVFELETRELRLVLAMSVHGGTVAFRASQLATFSHLQIMEAESRAEALATALDAEVAIASHPKSGYRKEPNGFALAPAWFQEESGAVSRFQSSDEMEMVASMLADYGDAVYTDGHRAEGLACEVPFGARDTSLVELVTSALHPWLGTGLLVLSRARLRTSWDDATSIAARLNALSLGDQSVLPGLGGWCAWPDGESWSLAHSHFLPNLMAQTGVARDAASSALLRMHLVDQLFHPDLGPRSAAAIVAARRAAEDAPAVGLN